MYYLLSLAVQAPFHSALHVPAIAAALLAAGGLGAGVYFSRKQFRQLRRKLVWTAIWHKRRYFRQPHPDEGNGCIFLALGILLVGILAIFLWRIALLVLLVLLIIWLIRRFSGRHTRYF